MAQGYPTFDEIKEAEHQLQHMYAEFYVHHTLFTWQWWLLLALFIISWIVWWKLVDQTRLKEITLFGAFMTLFVVLLDDIGSKLHLWSYPYQLFPYSSHLSSVDFSILPVEHMLIYQYFRRWRTFFVANVVLAFLFSFAAEPCFVWMGIYRMDHWRHLYSFPIYIAKAVLLRWLLERLLVRARADER